MTETSAMPEPDDTWRQEDYMAAAAEYMAQDGQDDPAGDDQAEGSQLAHGAQEGRRNSREATYRIRAKEAEATTRALQERVTRMQKAEVQRMAAQLHDPADLWQQVELVELLDEDGEVDPERVAGAVAALAHSKPYLLKPPPRTRGFGQGRRTPIDQGSGTTWGAVLRGRD
jgi:hypothetical protein